ncbi:MAG: SGNH/GDSL hydrolase family protein [Bacteroidota bacterium]
MSLLLALPLFTSFQAKNEMRTKYQPNNDQESTTMNMEKTFTFLALGDSYTIGESVDEKERWPVQLADSLKQRGIKVAAPIIIATTGWRTDELAASIKKEKPAKDFDMVSLLIGVNNQYQGKSVKSYEPEFKKLLKTAIKHAGGDANKVFVVSIPDYGYTPFGKEKQAKISRELDEYNAVNKRLTETQGISYYNITDISRNGFDDPELVAGDKLHPSGKQYSLWVELILQDENFLKRFD